MSPGFADFPGLEEACKLTVVIPAKNEEKTLERALGAFATQAGAAAGSHGSNGFDVIVYANDCDDETAAVARRFGHRHPELRLLVIEGRLPPDAAHVGTARRRVLDLAAQRFLERGRPRGIVATTDADTVVAPDWVATTLEDMRSADAVAGYVEADASGLSGRLRALYERERAYRKVFADISAALDPIPENPAPRHDSFVGASFAVAADAYVRCGGLPPLPVLEDRALFLALRRNDARVRHSLRVRATTSARRMARVTGGFGSFLRDLESRARTGRTFYVEDAEHTLHEIRRRAALRRLWNGVAVKGDLRCVGALSACACATGETRPVLDRGLPFGENLERFCAAEANAVVPLQAVELATAALRRALAARKALDATRTSAASGAG